jgi:cyclohexa-1,5-dienecarbonyl-CoA hydratase
MSKTRLEFLCGGEVAKVVLAAPKANILDRAMMAELSSIIAQMSSRDDLKAVVLSADGPSFSYGASVAEHLPEQIHETLHDLRELLLGLSRVSAPTIAAVRGQCLGGGFELALGCDLIIAEEEAQFGCPEIKLAVFPPAASALLPVKLGTARAANLVLTGNTWSGTVAAQCGLVSRLAPAGELDAALVSWLESDFLPRSPAALRYAARAVRLATVRALESDLRILESMYLRDLMAEPHAVEGIRAFLEKRQPHWAEHSTASR